MPIRRKGIFLSIEGIDGSGKSTQIKKIKDILLKKYKNNLIFTREPGGTIEAEVIRKLILNTNKNNWENESEILLLVTARYEHYKKLILPSIKKGKIVISDRFIDSTIAYQCNNNKKLKVFFNKISKLIFANFLPDLTILLDIDPKIAITRNRNRNIKNHYDKKSLLYFKKVRNTYLDLANKNSRINIIDASLNQEIITKKIIDLIYKKIKI